MKALIIDAGNTCVTCVAWEGSRQLPVIVADSPVQMAPPVSLCELGSFDHGSTGEGEEAFRALIGRVYEDAGRPPVALVSVVPWVAEWLPSGLDLVVVDHTSDLPFALDLPEPDRIGPDRLCNVAAAAAAGLASALVVDAGTATTFDLLIDGSFAGGMIAPGMAFAARKLGESAQRLSPVPFSPVSWAVGRDTRSAMAAGAWHAGIGGVRSVVAGLLARHGELPVIVTGGLGTHFADQGWFFDPHWTLRGAAVLSKR